MYYWIFELAAGCWRQQVGCLDLVAAFGAYHAHGGAVALVGVCRDGGGRCAHVLLSTAPRPANEALLRQLDGEVLSLPQ